MVRTGICGISLFWASCVKESTTFLFCEDKRSKKHFGLDKGYETTKLLQKFPTKTSFGPPSRGYWQNWSTERKKGSRRPKGVSPSENIAIVSNICAVVNQRKWSNASSSNCTMSLCLRLNEKFCCFRNYDYRVILRFSLFFLKLFTLFLTMHHENYCTAKSDHCFTFIFGL